MMRKVRVSAGLIISLVAVTVMVSALAVEFWASIFASKGDPSPYMGGIFHVHAPQRLLSYGLLGYLLWLNRPNQRRRCLADSQWHLSVNMWLLLVGLLLGGSATLINNYHVSLRATLPVLLFAPFFALQSSGNARGQSYAVLALAALPTFWLLYRMLAGKFQPL